jgi:hypothetical protein
MPVRDPAARRLRRLASADLAQPYRAAGAWIASIRSATVGIGLVLAAAVPVIALHVTPASAEQVIRVPPPGPGPVSGPAEALGRVAAMRARQPGQPLAVEFASGVYHLPAALRIGSEHSGTPGAPLVLRGAPDGSTHLVGSVPVSPAAVPADLANRLPAIARRHVRAYRLPAGVMPNAPIRSPRLLGPPPPPLTLEVYDERGALTPARWPNDGFARVEAGPGGDGAHFRLVGARPERWLGETDLWAEGYWRWDWLFETIPLRISGRAMPLRLGTRPYEGIRDGARARVVHALAELDEPGEWWRDRARNLLLVWPREGTGAIEVAVADTLLTLEGAAHVRIETLHLARSRGDLLTARGGRDVVVRNSALAWSGLRAAVFEDIEGGGLEACSIADTGFGAVRLSGGDRPSLRPGGLFLKDSRITRYARLSRTQSPAVELDGVGAQVTGNYIHDALDYAVHLRGNDHLVADNEIARLLQGATDSGAIYAGRDWTARGSTIRANFLHDLATDPGHEVKGVYLDDMASGFTVTGNLFLRVEQPVFIGGGRDNAITGNIFVASSPAVHIDARGLDWASGSVMNPTSEIRTALAAMPVSSPLWRGRYPNLAEILERTPGAARDNRITDNVFWLSDPFRYEPPARASDQTVQRNAAVTPDHPPGADTDPASFASPPAANALRLDVGRMHRSTLPSAPVPRIVPRG